MLFQSRPFLSTPPKETKREEKDAAHLTRLAWLRAKKSPKTTTPSMSYRGVPRGPPGEPRGAAAGDPRVADVGVGPGAPAAAVAAAAVARRGPVEPAVARRRLDTSRIGECSARRRRPQTVSACPSSSSVPTRATMKSRGTSEPTAPPVAAPNRSLGGGKSSVEGIQNLWDHARRSLGAERRLYRWATLWYARRAQQRLGCGPGPAARRRAAHRFRAARADEPRPAAAIPARRRSHSTGRVPRARLAGRRAA